MKTIRQKLNTCGLSLGMMLGLWLAHPAQAATYYVHMTSHYTFDPDYLEILEGDTVVWVNDDPWENHTSTSTQGAWDTPDIKPHRQVAITFPSAGYYEYMCTHCWYLDMVGVIVVSSAPAPTPALLLNPMLLQSGSFQFTVTNLAPGKTYVVQASSDLASWSNLSTNMAGNYSELYVDPQAASFGRRFYRTWHLP